MKCWHRKWIQKQKGSKLSVMHFYANSTSNTGKGLICNVTERRGRDICLSLCLQSPLERISTAYTDSTLLSV